MEPGSITYPLGALSRIEAETFGLPGRRTFRLALQSGRATTYVWLEKEQLSQLGAGLKEAVERQTASDRARASTPTAPSWPGGDTLIEFKARVLSGRHDQDTNSFYLQAHGDEDERSGEEAPSVSFWITVDQASELADESLRICASGRPICFLCGLPIDPSGHVCPRANGHAVFETG
jgi:uncharacterized repeat protein (TIGR03847 family)